MGRGGEGGGEELYPTLHCHHQTESALKMGSALSQLRVLLIVNGKVTIKAASVHKPRLWKNKRF